MDQSQLVAETNRCGQKIHGKVVPSRPPALPSPLCEKVSPLRGGPLFDCYSVTKSCLFATSWTAAHQASLSFTISQRLRKPMSIESVMPSIHLILCHPLLLPSIFPSIRAFSNESALCIRWTKYWSFSISPFNESSGLISFSIDWFDLLAVQETLKSLLQQHSSKASILRCSAFFIVQLSHPYIAISRDL